MLMVKRVNRSSAKRVFQEIHARCSIVKPRTGLPVGWVVAFLLVVSTAEAEPKNLGPEALFQQGLAEMQAGQHDVGCPKLAESYRLDPLPGALFTLAECEAAWGKIATAVEHYQTFVNQLTTLSTDRRASYSERQKIALDKIAALSSLAPELTIDVAEDRPGLVVKSNGVVISVESYGVSRRVDPGEYLVVAERDGSVVWQRRYVLEERSRARARIEWTEPATDERPPPVTQVIEPNPRPPSADSGSVPPTGAIVVGSIGVVGIVGGVVAGSIAWSKTDTIEENCPDRVCNEEGRREVEDAQSAARVSTIGFGVGVGAIGTAVVWWLLSKSEPDRTAKEDVKLQPQFLVGQHSAGFGVVGTL